MRVSSTLLAIGAMTALACGPVDQSGASISRSSGAPDAGAGSAGGSPTADAGAAPVGPAAPVSPASACGGVMPAAIPPPVTVTNAHGKGDICWNATADLAGNVAAESHRGSMGLPWTGNWQVWSPSGALLGGFNEVAGDVIGQQDGFQTTRRAEHVFYSSSGQEVSRTKLSGGCATEAFPSAIGGTLVLEHCGADLKAYRFDDRGALAARANLGQMSAAAGVIDARARVLIAGLSGGGYSARWYDADLRPSSAPFALPGSGGAQPMIRPLIGGGAAVQIGSAWVATIRSGNAAADAPPDWLGAHASWDLQIIRGGKAYALIPRGNVSPHNSLELYSGSGERCGSQAFPVDGLSVGIDGTVIGSAGEAECTHAFWSGLLR